MMETIIFSTTDIEELEESLHKIKQAIVDAFSVLSDRLKEIASAIDLLVEAANKKIDERRRNRSRWLYKQYEKMRQLPLDRRMTVHRCRNCC